MRDKNYRLFRVQMALHDETLKEVGAYLGYGKQTMYNKTNKFPEFCWNQRDIIMLAKHWNLTPQEVYDIFVDVEMEW